MQKKKLLRTAVCALVSCLLIGSVSAGASTVYSEHGNDAYTTYTYVESGSGMNAVYAKPMFNSAEVINNRDIGISPFSSLTDICVSSDKIFLLDSEQSRVVILNGDYSLFADYVNLSGETFTGAKGIYASGDYFYVADTENARVLVCSLSGEVVNKIVLPDSSLIPDNFKFKPTKVAVDSDGFTYILSDGSYYGAILYSPEGEFLGFYGSNTVTSSISAVLVSLWEKLTLTNEKRAKQTSKLPYQFTDLYIDKDNFIYTATGKTKNNQVQTGVVRKLSPSGTNILPSGDIVFGDQSIPSSGNTFFLPTQSIDGLCVDGDGFVYIYDSSYGKIYVYDAQCNMLNAFGGGIGNGKQNGVFCRVSGIDVLNSDILVIDSIKNSLTVFRINDYGKLLKKAQKMTLAGDYSNSEELWKQVYALDNNSQPALVGLAKSAYSKGNYRAAMDYAEKGFDRITYSVAFQHIRTEFLHKYFGLILAMAIVVSAAVWALLRVKRKKNIRFIKRRETKLMLRAAAHPAATFTELKQKGGWSVKWGIGILILFYISESVKSLLGSFVFVSAQQGSFSSLVLLVKTFGLVLLWTVSNWGVCTLFGGIGKIKEIFCVVTYSLIPMIIGNVIYTVLTNFFVPEEVAFLSVVMTVLQLYTVLMIIIGSVIIHDFSFGKFVGTAILTLIGILIVIFVGIIMIILVQQLIAFFATIYQEYIYR